MNLNIDTQVTSMRMMSVDRLRSKYAEVFDESTLSRNKAWMIKRIAWRLQANAEGGLSERARSRAAALANDADLRLTQPRPSKRSAGAGGRTATIPARIEDRNQLISGMTLTRIYKGQEILVTVCDNGFHYAGERFKSLTAVAKKVTGKHWNGFHFFNLRGGAE